LAAVGAGGPLVLEDPNALVDLGTHHKGIIKQLRHRSSRARDALEPLDNFRLFPFGLLGDGGRSGWRDFGQASRGLVDELGRAHLDAFQFLLEKVLEALRGFGDGCVGTV
jgi:hypothetical protein